jgi:hypothetical protein
MLKRQLSLVLIAILTFMMAMPVSAQGPGAAPSGRGLVLSVPLTVDDVPTTGTLTVKRFVKSGNTINAEGVLAFATATQSVMRNVSVPVGVPTAAGATGPTIQQAVCEVLHLVLGPLDLNIAGLEVHLDTVDLLIEADPSGGLLGSLLAGLLCGTGGLGGLLGDLVTNLQQVVNILNQILAILG